MRCIAIVSVESEKSFNNHVTVFFSEFSLTTNIIINKINIFISRTRSIALYFKNIFVKMYCTYMNQK